MLTVSCWLWATSWKISARLWGIRPLGSDLRTEGYNHQIITTLSRGFISIVRRRADGFHWQAKLFEMVCEQNHTSTHTQSICNPWFSNFWMRLSRIWRIQHIKEGVIQGGWRMRWITPSKICRILHILWKPNSTIIALLFIQNVSYPASSWFILCQTKEKPLQATVCFSIEHARVHHAPREAFDVTFICQL